MFYYTFKNGIRLFILIFANPSIFEQNTFAYLLFKVIFSLEIFVLLITTICYILFTKILINSAQFHHNLMRIFLFYSTMMLIHGPIRLALMLFEVNILTTKQSLFVDMLFITLSEFRIFCACTAGFIVQAIICERIFATYYIWHYEDTERAHVSKIILGGWMAMIVSAGIMASLWFPVNPIAFTISAMTAYSFFAGSLFVIYWRLWVYNHDVLHVLSDMHFGERQYTLGVRFQVEENIRAIKLLRCFIIFNMVFIGFNCFFTIIALMVLDPEQPAAQVALALLDLIIAIPPFSMLFISLYFVRDWGEEFLRILFRIGGRNFEHSSKNSIVPINPVQETEIYFTYYKANW